jgi:hypothetical protein
MNLKRFRMYPSVALKGRAPGDPHEALATYADSCRSVLDEAIDLWPLVSRTFLDADRALDAWRRRESGRPGA